MTMEANSVNVSPGEPVAASCTDFSLAARGITSDRASNPNPTMPANLHRFALVVAAIGCLSLPVFGQSPSAPAATSTTDQTVKLPEFTITADSDSGYRATNSVSGTRIATELKNLPVSIDVLTEQLFKDYGLTDVYEIMGMSAGVSNTQRAGGNESYTIRGFTTFFSARNGNTAIRSFDSANIARVEIVNGPASVLYGQMDPGGIANSVTKQPSAQRSSNARLEVGSWDYYRAEVGTTGPLNRAGTLLYRVDASYTDRDGYRDFDEQQKKFIAPVLRWQPLKSTTLTADMEYLSQFFTGLGNWPRYTDRTNNVVKFADMIPRTFNAQGPNLGTDTHQRLYSFTAEHKVSDRIVIRNQAGVTTLDRINWENGATAITTTTPTVLPFARSLSGAHRLSRLFANTLTGAARFDFNKQHYTRVVAGWDYNQTRTDDDNRASAAGSGAPTPPNWDLARPTTWDRNVAPFSAARTNAYSGNKVWEHKFYVVDALALFNERLMLLGGLNRTEVESITVNYLNGVRTRIKRGHTSPQVGGVFRVTPALGVYVNYSESFRQITSLKTNQDRSLSPFDPTITEGIDVGVKYDFADGRYSGQATLFNVELQNSSQAFQATDALGAYSYTVQTGATESQGAEFRLSANVMKDWQIIGGYTYADARITKNPSSPAIIGRALPRSPTHTATLTTSYRFSQGALKGVSVGANVAYRSQAKAFETTDPFLLDPRIVVNARAGYSGRLFGKPVNYNLLVNNALNERYYPSSLALADPTSWRFSMEYRF